MGAVYMLRWAARLSSFKGHHCGHGVLLGRSGLERSMNSSQRYAGDRGRRYQRPINPSDRSGTVSGVNQTTSGLWLTCAR